MADKTYLWKRGNTYSATLDVPKALQAALGTRRFVESLNTSNLAEANKRKLPYLMEWRRRIETARKGAPDPEADLMRAALEFRTALAQSAHRDQEPGDSDGELLSLIDDEARRVIEKRGRVAADRFRAVATAKATFIRDTYSLWLGQYDGTGQTKMQHGTAVNRYLAWAGATATVEDTTRKRAGEYVNSLIATSGLSKRTIQRHCSSLSSLWAWYTARGYVEGEVNPWRGHGLGKKPKGAKPYRRAYDDALILTLLKAPYGERYKETLPDLIRLALLTGARIEAFCALKRANVLKRPDGYWVAIEGDKTEAGNRSMPIHSSATALIERRMAGAGEYLFDDLTPGGPDRKRSWYVSKMFRYHKRRAGVTEKGQDFHAFRNTFIARMEGLGVPESTVQLLVGHERSSMTYGHYSKGEHVDKRRFVEMLDYGPEIMNLIRA